MEYIENGIEEDYLEGEVEDIEVSALFSETYKPTTIRLIVAWLGIYFIYYGITLLFPTIFHKIFAQKNPHQGIEYLYLLGLSVLELIFTWLSPAIMNHPAIGRKNAQLYSLIITFVASLLLIALQNVSFLVLFSLMACVKASNTVSLAVSYSLT